MERNIDQFFHARTHTQMNKKGNRGKFVIVGLERFL